MKPASSTSLPWRRVAFCYAAVVWLSLPGHLGAQSLSLNVPQSGTEGTTLIAAGFVAMDANTNASPVTVHLFSFNTNRGRVPSIVIIPPGTNAATFDLVLVENDLIDGTENVVIEAWLDEFTGDLDVIRVSDNESRALAITLPTPVVEGQGTLTNAGTILFFGTPVTNVVLALQSNHPELISVSASVTNFAGQTSVWFHLTANNDAVTNGFSNVLITASAPGFLSTTGTVHWIDDEPFVSGNPAPTNQAGDVSIFTTLSWARSPSVPPGTVHDVYLGTNPVPGAAELLGRTTGQTWAASPLRPGTTYFWQVVAGGLFTKPGPVWRFSTRSLDHFAFSVLSAQLVHEPFLVTITARDELDQIVTGFSEAVTLGASATGLTPHTILPSPTPSSQAGADFTYGYAFIPGTNLIITAVRHYFGSKVSLWTDTGELLVAQPVAGVPNTWTETPLAAPVPLTGGVRYRVASYTGGGVHYWNTGMSPVFPHGTISESRLGAGDSFPNSTSTSFRWSLVDLRYLASVPVPATITPTGTGPFIAGAWTGSLTAPFLATNMVLTASHPTGRTGPSQPFHVFTNRPPVITAHPVSRAVRTGTNVIFSVGVIETASPFFQWRRNGTDLADSERITGTASAMLTIQNTMEEDTGWYSVTVGNVMGSTTSLDATLNVHPLDHFSWSPVASPQFVGRPFAVTIEARDFSNRVVTNFTGPVALSGSNALSVWIFPTNSDEFTNGVWSGSLTVTNNATHLSLLATGGGGAGVSQSFHVIESNQAPVILVMPESRFVRPGSNVSFTVGVLAPTPFVLYQWQRNGTNLTDSPRCSGATGAVFTIENFGTNDEGTYAVLLSNEFGGNTSTNFSVRLDRLDHYTWDGMTGERLVGTPFTAAVRPRDAAGQILAFAPAPVLWSGVGEDGVPVTPLVSNYNTVAWTGDITITRPVTNLVLRAEDGTGRFGLSRAFQVAPAGQGPILLAAPTNLILRVGATARFSGSIYGGPSIFYSWNFTNQAIQNGGRISGQGTTTLTISNVVEGDARTYNVIMGNGLGPALVRSASLTVYRQDHFTWGIIPSPQSIYRPVSVRLEARDVSNLLVTNFTGAISLSAAVAGSGTPVSISPVTLSNFTGGVWSGTVSITQPVSNVVLRAEDALGHVGFSAPFNVERIAAFQLQPANQFVLPGTNVTLVAAAVGEGAVRYQWRFGGTNLPAATNASHSFTNANLTDHHGHFSVVVSDDLGSITSSNAFIYVLVRPGMVTAPRAQTVLQGGTAVFSCVATGAPPLAYRWIVNNAPLATSSVPSFTISNAPVRVPPLIIRVIVQNAAGSTTGTASTNVPLVVLADFDQDGQADAWENFYGFSTNNSSDALLDSDGDGLINRAEYLAGTDPTNASSVLKIFLSATNADALLFIAQSNVAYGVEQRTNLSSDSWSAFTSLAAQAFVRTVQVSVPHPPPAPARYYRIVTPPAP